MNNGVMGSMFTRYKDAGAGQSRLDHDLHPGTAAARISTSAWRWGREWDVPMR